MKVRGGDGACCWPKRKLRPKRVQPYAKLFKALADETRLEIVACLAATEGGKLCVCDIEANFDLSQPTISHHLRLLREARLVVSERRGTWVYYTLDRVTFARVSEFHALLTRRS